MWLVIIPAAPSAATSPPRRASCKPVRRGEIRGTIL